MSRRSKGVLIVYASMYGNTEAAAQALAAKLCETGQSPTWRCTTCPTPTCPT